MIKQLTEKQKLFLELLPKKAMNVSACCKDVGINRNTYYKWVDKNDTFRQKRDEAQESLYDMAESQIYKQMNEGNTTMLIFFAKTKMKQRGYIERQEIEHTGKLEIAGDLLYKK